jgi:2-keto-4-pentenoate hydratase
VRPQTRGEGYAVQQALLAAAGDKAMGWKIAATSEAGQKHINVSGPLAGRILSGQVLAPGAVVPPQGNRMRVAEAEFAFCMGRDLPPRATPYAMHEVLDAVDALYLAIEIPDSRYTDYVKVGAPQLIADNACGHQFVLGPKAPDMWRQLDLAAHRVVGHVGQRLQREGTGANVLGDPRLALTWLANELPTMGATLAAGHIVTTGTCVVPMDIQARDTVRMDFGVLGEVRCGFSGG